MQEEKNKAGLVPTHSYSALAGLGAVDLYTGGFTIALPLVSLPGRAGHNLNISASYNSKQIVRFYDYGQDAVRFYDEGWTAGRWKLNIWPQLQQEGSVYYFTSPDGAVHRIAWNPTHGTYVSDDSTNIRYSNYKVQYLSGESFDFSAFASQLKVHHLDPNGNRITYEFETAGSTVRPARIVDTLGRTVELHWSSPTSTVLSSLTVKNHAGADLTWSFSYATLEIRMADEPSYSVDAEYMYSWQPLLSSITQPDGRSWQFSYDHDIFTDGWSYYFDMGTRCQMTSLVMPTGASYAFEYYVPYGLSSEAAYDAGVSRYLDQVTVDPVGGGAFTTDYSHLPYQYDNNFLVKTIEQRADGSKREADWNAYGPSLGLRDRQRIYDTDGYTELQESFTTWGTIASGKTVTKSQVKDSPSGTWAYTERTTDMYGREVLLWNHDYTRSNASGTGPQFAFRTSGVRRWFDTDTSLWRSRLSRQDSLRWEGGQEVTTGSSEFLYDQYALLDRGTVVGQASGYGVSCTDRGNLTTTRVYDALNDRFLESQAHYDTAGNAVQQVDVLGRTTSIAYSAAFHYAYPTQVTDPLGHTAQTNYNFNTGLPISWTDANGQTTTQTYETYNRPLLRSFPDGGWADWTYFDQFNAGAYRTRVRARRSLTAAQNSIRNEYFDGLGRKLRTAYNESAGVWTYVDREYALCGCAGRTSRVSMPRRGGDPFYWTTTEYDGLGRVRKLIPPDGSPTLNFTEYRYAFTTETSAPRRRIRAVFDAKGVGIMRLYDADGTLRRAGEDASYSPLASSTWTDYDDYPGALRQKAAQWQGQSLTLNFAKHMFRQIVQGVQTRTFQHDALGRLVREEHPEFLHQGVQYGVGYLYDDGGRLIQKTDPRGVVTTTSYDDLNRPLSVTYSDATPPATYTYDQGVYGIGHLSSVSNSVASSSYTYDTMGRTVQEDKTIDGTAFSMSWAYNLGGQVVSYTLPNGTTISQTRDNLGRPTSIASDWVDASHPATLASNFAYHPAGALLSVDYGNGTTSTRTYTTGGLLKTLQHGTQTDPGALLDFEYDYQEGIANTGQIMQLTDHNDPSKTQTYTYDGFRRLMTAETQGTHWGLSWNYDRYGNRLTQTVTKGAAPAQSLSVNAQSNRATSWIYDRAGNVLNDGQHSFAFDAENRITTVDGGATVYLYDASGARVAKVAAAETAYYFFDLSEYKAGGGWSKLWLKLGREKLAEYSAGTTTFFHADHLGTVRHSTDAAGVESGSWQNLPFGEQWPATEPPQHFFTGHERDGESGHDYAGARYYANNSGRWLGVDSATGSPQIPQSLNRFAYAFNNPVNYIDPDGRWPVPPVGLIQEAFMALLGPGNYDIYVTASGYGAPFGSGGVVGFEGEGGARAVAEGGFVTGGRGEGASLFDILKQAVEYLNQLAEAIGACEALARLFEFSEAVYSDRNQAIRDLVNLAGHGGTQEIDFGSSGFRESFRDPAGQDQAHHAVGAIAAGFLYGRTLGRLAADARERITRNDPEDYRLNRAAALLGAQYARRVLSFRPGFSPGVPNPNADYAMSNGEFGNLIRRSLCDQNQ